MHAVLKGVDLLDTSDFGLVELFYDFETETNVLVIIVRIAKG